MKNKFYTLMWKLLRPFVLLLHPLDVQGRENLPDEPVLICANHSSGWDPVLLVCALASDFPLRIMAKEQLFKIPIIGGFIRRMGAFPVDRGNSDIGAVKTSIKSLKDGFSLLIFPEGTRVKEGHDRHPCRCEDAAGVYRHHQAAVPEDPLCDRQALYPGVY